MTNQEINRLSAPVVQAYRDMEDEVLRLIAKQIAKDGRLSDTSKWRIRQLARAGEVNRQAMDIIDSYSGGISAEVYDAIIGAAEGEVGRLDDAMLNLLSEKGHMTADVQESLEAFERQSKQELNVRNAEIAGGYAEALSERCNLVNTVMGYSAQSAYSQAVRDISAEVDRQGVLNVLNEGAADLVSGNMSLQEATRKTIHKLAEKGLPGFVDRAGRQWSPEAYVRMDLRSTMGNAARAAQDARCDAYGIDLIEVSSHLGARPKCAPYQGRIFSRDGSRGITEDLNGDPIEYTPLSETSYGEPDGLFGINCGHQQYPFMPGLSLKTYYPYDEAENAERYEETQRQRALERKIRADKRECMMLQEAGDTEGLQKAAGQLRADRDRYKDFCKEKGLSTHNENTQVLGYDRSKSMKTVWAGRTKGSGNGENAADSKGLTSEVSSGKINTKGEPGGAVANKPREELLKMIEKSNSLDKPIYAVDTPHNKFASNARKIKPQKGFYDVALHGTENSVEFFDTQINASDFGKIIKSRSDYVPGTPVRLFSCNTGNIENTGDCFAQLLATELNAEVYAPDNIIYVDSNGDFSIEGSEDNELKRFWSRKYW